jgi:hypothetical protein
MSGPRVLRRPPNGWDRRPNSQLGDLLMLVAWMFGGACFFNWASQALGMLLEAAGLA